MNFTRLFRFGAIAMLAAQLSACADFLGNTVAPALGTRPAPAPTASAAAAFRLKIEVETNSYNGLTDPGVRATKRNQIIYEQLEVDDLTFDNLEWEVWASDAGVATTSDWTTLILTALASVNPGAAPSLAAAATGVTGARLSLQKNFLYDQTVSSLLVSMEINRAQIRNHIASCLAQPDNAYPLYAAQYDEQQYQSAAILPSAVARLTATATVPNPGVQLCFGSATAGTSLRDDLRNRINAVTSTGLKNLESVMSDLGITLSSPSSLSADQSALISWMNSTTDQNVARLNASIQIHFGPVAAQTTP